MPQASDEQLAEWGIDDAPVVAFLYQRGYVLREDWFWKKPSPDYEPTEKELSAIVFLICEWDYGGIVHGFE